MLILRVKVNGSNLESWTAAETGISGGKWKCLRGWPLTPRSPPHGTEGDKNRARVLLRHQGMIGSRDASDGSTVYVSSRRGAGRVSRTRQQLSLQMAEGKSGQGGSQAVRKTQHKAQRREALTPERAGAEGGACCRNTWWAALGSQGWGKRPHVWEVAGAGVWALCRLRNN